MDYINSLQCKTEPFASHSGTEIYLSQALRDSIEKLSHYILLGAGLHLVLGTNGSGKTTLLNNLSQKFSADNKTVVLLLNNPHFSNLQQFLIAVTGVFKTIKTPSGVDDNTFQKAFNTFFYKLCQQQKKTVLLLMDNGQDLPDFCLHALNSFYDHHPDCRRFLQTVICGEPLLQKKINAIKALSSRVVFTAILKPFHFKDTRKLIRFHLEHAAADPNSPPALFSFPAQWAIYRLTQGHPQKIIDLCHFIVLTLIIENRKKAGWFMSLRCAKQLIPMRAKKLQIIRVASLSSLIVFMLVIGLWSQQIQTLTPFQLSSLPKLAFVQRAQPPKPQPAESAKVAQKTVAPEQLQKVSQPEPEVKKETPPEIPTKEPDVMVTAPENLAVVPQPQDKPDISEAPSPESTNVTVEAAIAEPKPVAKVETIVTPTIRERREVRPGDTFTGMIQQVYGPSYVKLEYIDKVIAANPHLKDPENLEVGEQIFFPVLVPEKVTPVVAAAVPQPRTSTEKVSEVQPVASPGHLQDKQVEPPEFLGDIITGNGETFGDMIRRIYGPWSFNPENVKKVMAVNPELKSPEQLYVGHKIRFPAIPVGLTPKAAEVWWVRITTLDDIQSAYRFLREYRKSAPPLLIIPSREDSGRILMNVLLEEYFTNEESARKAIHSLPPTITPQAEALHGLNPAIFYFRMKQSE
jgi:general secretion pathway protein A